MTRIALKFSSNRGTENLALVGIHTRACAGAAGRQIRHIEGADVPVGVLDITLYRDDLTTIAHQPVVRRTEIPFDVTEDRRAGGRRAVHRAHGGRLWARSSI